LHLVNCKVCKNHCILRTDSDDSTGAYLCRHCNFPRMTRYERLYFDERDELDGSFSKEEIEARDELFDLLPEEYVLGIDSERWIDAAKAVRHLDTSYGIKELFANRAELLRKVQPTKTVPSWLISYLLKKFDYLEERNLRWEIRRKTNPEEMPGSEYLFKTVVAMRALERIMDPEDLRKIPIEELPGIADAMAYLLIKMDKDELFEVPVDDWVDLADSMKQM